LRRGHGTAPSKYFHGELSIVSDNRLTSFSLGCCLKSKNQIWTLKSQYVSQADYTDLCTPRM
jgi:hypothetical protein